MPKRTRNPPADKGRNFYETSSPFETYEPGGKPPKTYRGLVDETPLPGGKLTEILTGEQVLSKMQAEQYDNPRGYPGLALVTRGSQKAKLPFETAQHSIQHHAEGEGSFSRTGKRS